MVILRTISYILLNLVIFVLLIYLWDYFWGTPNDFEVNIIAAIPAIITLIVYAYEHKLSAKIIKLTSSTKSKKNGKQTD